MNSFLSLLAVPADLEAQLILVYVAVVLGGAHLIEALARSHFARARRYAEQGFAYDADEDQYRCPQGETLQREESDAAGRLAVYRALASSCNACPLKGSCTPHDQGRQVYRPLAVWAETDVGRFHQRLSLLMFAAAGVLSAAGLVRWTGRPGMGLLAAALMASFACLLVGLRRTWQRPPQSRDRSVNYTGEEQSHRQA
jgi:hypothetical protein